MKAKKDSLGGLPSFVDLLQKFRAVERKILVKESNRYENDQEHSYSLAMLAWYVNDVYKLGLNGEKILKYALAHDLVEAYAGDTYFYTTNKKTIVEKEAREAKAFQKIQKEFSHFSELGEIIERYEKRKDPESRFIYALDKVEPIFAIYRDGGRTWKKQAVTFEMLISKKAPKVAGDKTVQKIFEELVLMLKKDEKRLF